MTQVIHPDGTMEGPGSVWVIDSDGRAMVNAHLLDGYHASATAEANKILALDDDAKLPASITGDADTVDGYHAKTSGADAHVVATDASGNATITASHTVGKTLTAPGLVIPYARTLTIDSGAITVAATDGVIRVDTEDAAATDDLVTINGGTEGQILVISTQANARGVTIKHAAGNIYCGSDRVLDHSLDRAVFIHRSGWVLLAFSSNY